MFWQNHCSPARSPPGPTLFYPNEIEWECQQMHECWSGDWRDRSRAAAFVAEAMRLLEEPHTSQAESPSSDETGFSETGSSSDETGRESSSSGDEDE